MVSGAAEAGGERAASASLGVKSTELPEVLGSPLCPGGRHTGLTYNSLLDGGEEDQSRAGLSAGGRGVTETPHSSSWSIQHQHQPPA